MPGATRPTFERPGNPKILSEILALSGSTAEGKCFPGDCTKEGDSLPLSENDEADAIAAGSTETANIIHRK